MGILLFYLNKGEQVLQNDTFLEITVRSWVFTANKYAQK